MNSQPLIDTARSLVGSGRGLLQGLILKPNMVLPGLTCPHKESVNGVVAATVQCLREVVPAPYGIAFLSGGFGSLKRHALGKPIDKTTLSI